ncbi:structural maintenance of chromosomes protein 4-like isoform X2 [Tenebrio molitor]|uniref:structural maintenance of chromosomes protein 4-like isoform X2 n=1 Tax=Tenebrio molitor TaxID=7067 RepID=UPI0036248998
MGTVHASLQVVNNTDTDITTISVSSVDGFDWKDHSSPDLIFKGVSIGAKRSEERQLAMKRIANHCPFNMTLHFRNGNIDIFRIHQKYAVRNCRSGFQHIQRSHDISYKKEDRKLIIIIENTEQQLQNEQAKERSKEGQIAMGEKQYETAIKKFDEALKLAHESSTISSIKNNKSEALNKEGESLVQKARLLKGDMTQEIQNILLGAKDLFKQAGNEDLNKALKMEKAASEAFEAATNSNKIGDYKTAEEKYEEALKKCEAAKEKFDEGSKIHSEKFVAFSELIDDHFEGVKKKLDRIREKELRFNMSTAHLEEDKVEENGNQVGIKIKTHKVVDVTTTDGK